MTTRLKDTPLKVPNAVTDGCSSFPEASNR